MRRLCTRALAIARFTRTFAPTRRVKATAYRQRRRQAVALLVWFVRWKYCSAEVGIETASSTWII
jgi:hypothetical protein